MRALALAALVGVGCTPAQAAPDPCSAAALKLGGAKLLVEYKKPEACTPLITSGQPAVIKSQQEYDTYFKCAKDVKYGIDWTKQALVFDAWNMSPAAVGLDAFDDGKVITFVARDRAPCPKDPHPMPITLQKYYVTTAGGAARTFGSASCTITSKCN